MSVTNVNNHLPPQTTILNNDALEHVFSFLNLEEQANARRVSTQFRDVLNFGSTRIRQRAQLALPEAIKSKVETLVKYMNLVKTALKKETITEEEVVEYWQAIQTDPARLLIESKHYEMLEFVNEKIGLGVNWEALYKNTDKYDHESMSYFIKHHPELVKFEDIHSITNTWEALKVADTSVRVKYVLTTIYQVALVTLGIAICALGIGLLVSGIIVNVRAPKKVITLREGYCHIHHQWERVTRTVIANVSDERKSIILCISGAFSITAGAFATFLLGGGISCLLEEYKDSLTLHTKTNEEHTPCDLST